MVKTEEKDEKNFPIENPYAVKCPACGLYSTIILDPKKVSDEKSSRLCLVCGHLFEYFNQTENKIMRNHS